MIQIQLPPEWIESFLVLFNNVRKLPGQFLASNTIQFYVVTLMSVFHRPVVSLADPLPNTCFRSGGPIYKEVQPVLDKSDRKGDVRTRNEINRLALSMR